MFNRIGNTWKAHTPKVLHPYSKENIITQIVLGLLFVLGLIVKTEWEDRKFRKFHENNDPYKTV
jgi:flagellar biogenesis protein FliO